MASSNLGETTRPAVATDPGGSVPWLYKKDIFIALGLPPLAAISWIAPPQAWRGLARRFAPLYAPGRGAGSRARLLERIERTYAPGQGTPWLEAALEQIGEEEILALIETLREYRPGGWAPEIELSGQARLEAALARGKGAVLWIGHFVHAALIPKMAFHRAGFPLAHLSHPRHGFSKSWMGVHLLNPVKRVVEDRYLRARVMLEPGGPAAAMADLAVRLSENGVVSILGTGAARRPSSAPFLGGEIKLATGAPRLAYTSGAALLPVIPVRTGCGGFSVVVEPAIAVDPSLPRQDAVESAVRAYAKVLERHVTAYPGQWQGWFKA